MYRDRNEEMIYFCFLNFRVDDFDLQGEYTKTGQNLPIYALLELQPSAKIGEKIFPGSYFQNLWQVHKIEGNFS